MRKITILGLAVAISMMSCTVPVAEAEPIPPPYQQVRDGTPTGEVVCAGDRMLMLSPSGKPACVFAGSVEVLERRGFVLLSEVPRDDLSSKQPASEKTEETGTITLTDSENPDMEVVSYTIAGGNIISVVPMIDPNYLMFVPGGSLIVSINATDDGYVTLKIPRTVADAKGGNVDLEYFVLVDGEESDFEESRTDNARTLTIDFVADTEEIEIIGTFVVPEFGTMTTVMPTAEAEPIPSPYRQARDG